MIQAHALHSLRTLLSRGQILMDRSTLIAYEVDAGLDKGMPDAVVFPRTPEEVERIMRWATEHGVALIARGAGTGLSGGAVADRGGVIVEFVHMNAILDIDPQGRSALAEPALINLRLDEAVKPHDLYFPPDPASQRASTIGGNVAENSGGPHCFKYGVTTNYVTGLEVVMADGERVRLGGRALDYPEYDLCGLVTGSEGTLALITAITVRLVRNPPGVKTLLVIFDSVEQAGLAVSAVIAAGLVPATIEMMDQRIVRVIEPFAQAGLPLDAGAVLIVEIDGHMESLEAQMHEIVQVLERHGGHSMRVARDEEERAKIWKARKSVGGAIAREVPAYYTVDITVPRSLLTEMLHEVYRICERNEIRAGQLFHAGDGNLHPLLQIPDPDDPALIQRVHRAGHEIVQYCVEMGGSLTGEHGVGIEKREFMPLMHTHDELLAMWDIKQAFDPACLLNPGKIFPEGEKIGVCGEGDREGREGTSPTSTQRGVGMEHPMSTRRGVDDGFTPSQPLQSPVPDPHAHRALTSAPIGPDADVGGQARGAVPTEDVGGQPRGDKSFSPSTAEEARQLLLALSGEHKPVFIQGVREGSLLQQSADDSASILSTHALSGIKDYAPDDLVITVGAGTSLREVQTFLAQHRQQLALASPWPEATIGGLVATNTNAPLRMRYGAVRDQVLCMTVALPDGRVIRTGRPLVKNVAGYDLTKAFIGSYGTLGLICDVALKISAQPRERRTILIPVETIMQGMQLGQQLMRVALIASAVVLCKGDALPEWSWSNYVLVYTAEGMPEEVQAELAQVRRAGGLGRKAGDDFGWKAGASPAPTIMGHSLPAGGVSFVGGGSALGTIPTGSQLWSDLLGNWSKKHLVVRTGVPIKGLSEYVRECALLMDSGDWIVDIANGFVYTMHECAPESMDEAVRWLNAVRAPALKRAGYTIVIDMPALPKSINNGLDHQLNNVGTGQAPGTVPTVPGRKHMSGHLSDRGKASPYGGENAYLSGLDRWGYQPDSLHIMKRLKARWDAADILNPSTFLVR